MLAFYYTYAICFSLLLVVESNHAYPEIDFYFCCAGSRFHKLSNILKLIVPYRIVTDPPSS
nr:MAG TPA: hypothetical protein [Caudoviricetes sp.]